MPTLWQPNQFEIKIVDADMIMVEGTTRDSWGIHLELPGRKNVLTYLGPTYTGFSVTDQGTFEDLQELADKLDICLDKDGSILYKDQMKRIVNAYTKNIRNRDSE